MHFRPTHKPLRAFISSAKAGDIHFCMPVASWSLVTWYSGEHRHCKCDIRQRFKEERMCKHIHTTLPQVDSDCCMSRSTYALLPYSLHKWSLARRSPTKICTIQSNKHLPIILQASQSPHIRAHRLDTHRLWFQSKIEVIPEECPVRPIHLSDMKPFSMVKGISVAPVAHYRTSLDKVRTYYGHLMDNQRTEKFGSMQPADF